MSSFFQKIKDLFGSEDKKFKLLLLEELENKNFINIRKLESKLNLEKRYVSIRKLLTSNSISGVFLPEKSFFFSITDDDLNEIRSTLKKQGELGLTQLKNRWNITEKTLIPFLQHLDKGLIGGDKFYSINYLHNSFASLLRNVEEYDIQEIQKKYNIDVDQITHTIRELINEKEINGVIQDEIMFLGSRQFESIISEFIEENLEDSLEMTFERISEKLKVSEEDTEKFLVKYVDSNPHKLVIYPLEKKIIFKG
ncbi:MAG: hypothetical protein GOP50_07885 [Candidatus Heimdallarchaeota archaeon]|nr:hypothetical protein [Candidatus Heimdallarchaeota archaeon]